MQVRTCRRVLATVAVALFAASMAWAGFPGHHHSSQKSGSLDLSEVTKIPGGPTLEPGRYQVTLLSSSDAPKVEFYQDGKPVGQAPVRLVAQDKKISATEMFTNTKPDHTQVLTELDLGGWTQKLVFETSNGMHG